MTRDSQLQPEVLVIGAGPAGLAAAIELKEWGIESVAVLEREPVAGGIPRHCFHTGFGVRDLKRIIKGPTYAARYVRMAAEAGVEIHTESTAIGWEDGIRVRVASPKGVHVYSPQTVLLATGCRERPRSARLVPGDRPAGVFTTGALQQLVHLRSQTVGSRAVVVGAEHVSYSAVETLLAGGCETVGMLTEFPAHQTYRPFQWWVARRRHIPLHAHAKVVNILGRNRVEAVEYLDLRTQESHTIACDTVVFTGDWIPDHELARQGGLAINKWTNGPETDQGLRTSRPGVFAAGNLLRGAEMAETAALEGRYAAREIVRYLHKNDEWPTAESRLSIEPVSPIKWVSPNAFNPAGPGYLPRNQLVFRVDRFLGMGKVELVAGSRVLLHRRFLKLVPNQWYSLRFQFETLNFPSLSVRFRGKIP